MTKTPEPEITTAEMAFDEMRKELAEEYPNPKDVPCFVCGQPGCKIMHKWEREPGIKSGAALLAEIDAMNHTPPRPKVLTARKLEIVLELVAGLPEQWDEEGKVTKRGRPIVTAEQALELLMRET